MEVSLYAHVQVFDVFLFFSYNATSHKHLLEQVLFILFHLVELALMKGDKGTKIS